MSKIKQIFKEKGMLISVIVILLICSIALALAVYAQITKKGVKTPEDQTIDVNYEDLKNNFQDIFSNSINKEDSANLNINYDEFVFTKYTANKKTEKYSVEAQIPSFKEENDVLKKINEEIYNTFATVVLKIANNVDVYTTFNLNYVSYVNNNIISLVIMCKYKDGAKPQRKIVQSYNYDMENQKLLSIEDIINYKELNKNEMQKKVKDEIKKINSQTQSISSQGYNVYSRDENSEIYQIENTPNFFLGKNNYLYLIYAYGNDNYTSEMDLVIFN